MLGMMARLQLEVGSLGCSSVQSLRLSSAPLPVVPMTVAGEWSLQPAGLPQYWWGAQSSCIAPAAAPNQRMKLSWRSGRLKGKRSILIAAAAPRSLCAIR